MNNDTKQKRNIADKNRNDEENNAAIKKRDQNTKRDIELEDSFPASDPPSSNVSTKA